MIQNISDREIIFRWHGIRAGLSRQRHNTHRYILELAQKHAYQPISVLDIELINERVGRWTDPIATR